MPTVETLQIQLLGGFRLLYHEHPIGMVHQLRLQSLLAYLVLHPDLPHARQHLAFLFWPDTSETQARANLRKAIYELRKLLPNLEHFVQIEDQFLQWRNAAGTSLDVAHFAASLARAEQANQPAVARRALEEAVALYGGDLLPACYDDWVLLARERLRQHYIKALAQLIALLEQQRELGAALEYAQRLLHYDALHESTYRILMRLHVLNGDRATALRTYHTCVTRLQQELGVEPSPETQTLYQRLLLAPTDPAQAKPTSRAAKGALAFVGRQPEWQTLQAAWQAAAAGLAQCVVIVGEAGMGKTRLAEELLQWVERQGYATAHTRSYAAEGRLAYAPITDWLRADAIRARLPQLESVWLVEVARLLPDLLVARPDLPPPAPLADSWQRQRFREALARAITLGHQPLLLVIDDLQWCDHETLEWLRYLLRWAEQKPLLVVGTVRAEEVDSDHPVTTLLMDLRQADQLTEIELGPLTSAETAELAAQMTGGVLEGKQADALYGQTEGHPLFVVEMLRASDKQGTFFASVSSQSTVALPPKVQTVIQSRLAQLSPPTRELAGLAATVGRAFTIEVLAQASDSDEDSLVRGLDELWQRRLIREQGEHGYDFSHDKIREAAYTSISLARRRLLHRRVAQALEQVHGPELDSISGELAEHYKCAGLLDLALTFYQKAAAVAERIYAHDEARGHLVKVVEILKTQPVSRERLQQELIAYLSLTTSMTVLKGVSSAEANVVSNQAYELAVQVGDIPQRFSALVARVSTAVCRGELAEALDLAKQRLALVNEVGDASEQATAHGPLGIIEFYLGNLTTARTFLEQGLARATDQSFYSTAMVPIQHLGLSCHRHLLLALWHLGYPDQATEQMNEALTRSDRLSHPYTTSLSYTWAASLHQYRGEIALMRARVEVAIALCLEYGFTYNLHQCYVLQGWALTQQGQVEAGMAQMHQSIAIRETMDARIHQPKFLALLAEVYGQVGQPEVGLRLLDEAVDMANASEERWPEAELYRLQGELLHMQGADVGVVESRLLRALAVARQQEAKSLELRAAMSLCRLWQQQGRLQEARDLLAEIYGWFTEGFNTRDLVDARVLLEQLS